MRRLIVRCCAFALLLLSMCGNLLPRQNSFVSISFLWAGNWSIVLEG